MKRTMLVTIVALSVAAPAGADLKMVQVVSGKGLGMNLNVPTTVFIKGMKMRTDSVSGDTTRTMIFDVGAQKLYNFDNKKKEADVWDMAAFAAQIGSNADTSSMTASLKANGQTKEIAGRKAEGYDISVTMPTMVGDPKNGMKMMVNLTGPMWVVKGAPGSADYSAFYNAAAEKGFIFGDPRAAQGAAGQMKAIVEMHRQLAALGGIPYEMVMNVQLGGDGPMAGMMARMGGMSSTSIVQSADVGPLADELFGPPAGYKLNARK